MKKIPLKSKLLLILIGFCILFIMRLAYGYIAYPDAKSPLDSRAYNANQSAGFELARKNYASSKMSYKKGGVATQSTASVDQKYEKVGTLKNLTETYKDDENKLYELIKSHQLMIQLEQKSGQAYSRKLNIALGVVPDNFDKTIALLQKIGTPRYIQIDKKDKTNEYKKLEAKRVSLQKARESLLELKQSEGDVGDMIGLVNRLLEVENDIQALGVNLGEFDVQNEFVTVKFTLQEVGKVAPISVMHRVKVALVWSVEFYVGFWAIIIFGLLALWLFFIVFEKGMAFKDKVPFIQSLFKASRDNQG